MSEEPPVERAALVGATLDAWQRELTSLGGPNTLLWYRDGDLALDLTRAHPGGVARFLAGSRTRLSDLFREPSAYQEASTKAAEIRQHAQRLLDERGLTTAYLAVGLATWRPPAGQRQAVAPVLLRQVALNPVGHPAADAAAAAAAAATASASGELHDAATAATPLTAATARTAVTALTEAGDDGDLALDLGAHVEVNPVLISYLREGRRISVDAAALEALAHGEDGITPGPVFARLRELCADIPGFEVLERQVVSTFPVAKMAHVADLGATRDALARSEIVALLAGVESARPRGTDRIPAWQDNPDPRSELLVLDADSTQRAAIDAARADADVVITTPPGTGATQTVANALATLAAQGRRVLLVAEDARELESVVDRLRTVGLDDLILTVPDGGRDRLRVVRELALTLERRRHDRADAHRQPGAHHSAQLASLAETSARLAEHARTMHAVREPWGVTAYEVENRVAAAARAQDPPSSRVRLTSDTVAATRWADVERVSAEIVAAAESGGWATGRPDPWYGARVTSLEDADRARGIVERLAGTLLDDIGARVRPVLEDAGLPIAPAADPAAQSASLATQEAATDETSDPGETVGHWVRAVETLDGVHRTLEIFRPEVFATDLREHILAADDGSDLGWAARSRVRRETRTLLRPGPVPDEIADNLRDAATQRDAWKRLVGPGSRPRTTPHVPQAQEALAELVPDLTWLGERLATTPAGGALLETPLPELRERAGQLTAATDRLGALPELVGTLDHVAAAGFGELTADLAARGVPSDRIPAEVEHVWWSSLAAHLVATDRAYAAHDGPELHESLTAYRILDRAHLGAGPMRVRAAVAEHAMRADRAVIDALTRAVAAPPPVRTLVEQAGAGLLAIAPVWAMSPYAVPAVLPPGVRFDTLVILDAQATTAARVAGALARSERLVAVGDPLGPPPTSFVVGSIPDSAAGETSTSLLAALAALPHRSLGVVHGHRNPGLLDVLATLGYAGRVVAHPSPDPTPPLRLEQLHTTSDVVPEADEPIESSPAEVAAVVALVRGHLTTRPEESLAVIAVTDVHARRIAAGLGAAGLSAGLAGRRAVEVAAASDCGSVAADRVILAVGYAKTRHGRVLYRFSTLAGPDGATLLVAALGRARREVTVVSSLAPDELEDSRLTLPGPRLLKDLLRYAAQGPATPASGPTADADPVAGAEGGTGRPGGAGVAVGPGAVLGELADRLRKHGLSVEDGPAGVDLVVRDPDAPGSPRAAVLGDGPAYAAQRCVRDRDRLRPEALTRLGWRVVQVWNTDIFRDPARDVVRVLTAMRGEADHRATGLESGPDVGPYSGLNPGSDQGGAAQTPRPGTTGHADPDAPGGYDTEAGGGWLRRRRRRADRPATADGVTEHPGSTYDDTDLGWGDLPTSGRDAWLKEQRPPHWE